MDVAIARWALPQYQDTILHGWLSHLEGYFVWAPTLARDGLSLYAS